MRAVYGGFRCAVSYAAAHHTQVESTLCRLLVRLAPAVLCLCLFDGLLRLFALRVARYRVIHLHWGVSLPIGTLSHLLFFIFLLGAKECCSSFCVWWMATHITGYTSHHSVDQINYCLHSMPPWTRTNSICTRIIHRGAAMCVRCWPQERGGNAALARALALQKITRLAIHSSLKSFTDIHDAHANSISHMMTPS